MAYKFTVRPFFPYRRLFYVFAFPLYSSNPTHFGTYVSFYSLACCIVFSFLVILPFNFDSHIFFHLFDLRCCAVTRLFSWTRVSDLGSIPGIWLYTLGCLSTFYNFVKLFVLIWLVIWISCSIIRAYDDISNNLSGFQWDFISMIWLLHTLKPILT